MNCNTTHYRANSSSVPGDPTVRTGQRAINFTSDIGIGRPGTFTGALAGAVGPFLTRVGGPISVVDPLTGAIEQFVGDPNSLAPVTGSVVLDATGSPQNYVRIQGPGGLDMRTNLFAVSGKVFGGVLPTALKVERATYSRSATGATSVDVFASTPPGAAVAFRAGIGNVVPPASETALRSDGLGNHFERDNTQPAPPAVVVVTATTPVAPGAVAQTPTAVSSTVVDQVTVTRADYSRNSRTLVIEATSSDEMVIPTVRALGFAEFAQLLPGTTTQRISIANVAEPPARVRILSAAGGSDSRGVTVLRNPNANPVGVADNATTTQDQRVDINVLANDSDPDNNVPLEVANLSVPAHGTLVLNANQTVTYTPAAGFFGFDSFTYQARDTLNALSATTTVTVRVNAPPVAVNDGSATAPIKTNAGIPLAINVLANDTDVDGPAPLVVGAITQPVTGGTVVSNGSGVTFTPAPGFSGTTSFTYRASDGLGALSAPAIVTVQVVATVNAAPVAVNDGSVALPILVTAGVPRSIAVLANDTDIDGPGPLSVGPITQPARGGTVVNDGSAVTFTPKAGFTGTTTFTYRARDGAGALSAPATVTVRVDANQRPTAVDDGSTASPIVVSAGVPLTIDVLANDTDVDGPFPLSVASVTQSTRGTVVNNGSSVTFRPNAGFTGSTSFTYVVRDGAGLVSSKSATVRLQVK